MKRRVRILSVLAAGTLALAVGTSTAHAALNKDQLKCQKTIAKEGLKFVKGQLKLRQQCIDDKLAGGPCTTPDAAKLQNLVNKLRSGLAKGCTFDANTPGNLGTIGFPGPCIDPDSGDNFTLTDLQDCIENTHRDAATAMIGMEYDADLTTLADPALTCQKTIAKNLAKYVASYMKTVQKCRTGLRDCKTKDGIETCKVSGVLPQNCATDLGPALASKCDGGTNDGAACGSASECPGGTCAGVKFANQKTVEAIAKAETKARDAILNKCSNADVQTIQACEPDLITVNTTATTCEIDFHQDLTDNPDITAASDLMDYEYAQQGLCGDDRKNRLAEECDGTDDVDCPGQCGDPLGLFPCLCEDLKRLRVVEHANADLDNGYTGQSHDSGVVEGGGYVTDLWNCDGPLGPDTLCNIGPHCSLAPNSPCAPQKTGNNQPPPKTVDFFGNSDNGQEMCDFLGQGICNKTVGGATGPYCALDVLQWCETGNDCKVCVGGSNPDAHCAVASACPGGTCALREGDSCIPGKYHSAPLPLASGGVSVCVVNTFTEDIAGTKDLVAGSGAVRLRQVSATYLGPDQQQPCPVCGGFCSGNGGPSSPGVRNLCTTDADCTAPATCVHDLVCSWGPNKDQECNPNTPVGGPTEFFGTTSADCQMAGTLLGQIDILFNPTTTGVVTKTANIDCGTTGFNNKVCAGGPNQHAVCTVDSECPGGTCNEQCFCPGSGQNQKPNGCEAACVGGPDDANPCIDNSECTAPGFCHPADCRLNQDRCEGGPNEGTLCTVDSECPGGTCGDFDSCQEGRCTVGPDDRTCSGHTFVSCISNAGCRPSGTCPFCDESETCDNHRRECFVNPTIMRCGSPGVPDHQNAAVFCEAKTESAAVNLVAGVPGPAAETAHVTDTEVGFPTPVPTSTP